MLAMAHRQQGIGRIDSTELVSAAYLARLSVAPFGRPQVRREGPMKRPRSTPWQSLKRFVRNNTTRVFAALPLARHAFPHAAPPPPSHNPLNPLHTPFPPPIS